MSEGATIRAVVFDVGETLVDETRPMGEWADRLGISRLTFFAVLGGIIARGEAHRRAAEILRPDLDLGAEAARQRAERGTPWIQADDFYPDALPAIRALKEAGYRVGIAGNQPLETGAGHRGPRDPARPRRDVGGPRPREARPGILRPGRRGARARAPCEPPREAAATIDSLLELPDVLAGLG